LKVALKDIPDEVLEQFGAGFSEEQYVGLMNWAGDDELEGSDIWESSAKKYPTIWESSAKKYPTIRDIDNWIENISKLSEKIQDKESHWDTKGYEEALSSEDKIE